MIVATKNNSETFWIFRNVIIKLKLIKLNNKDSEFNVKCLSVVNPPVSQSFGLRGKTKNVDSDVDKR